jgi:antitoxin ParD1/3/4
MEVKISPELERKVMDRVGGPYESVSDVVEEALRAFFGPESLSETEIEDLNRRIANGLAEAERGDTVDGEEALRQIRERLQYRGS